MRKRKLKILAGVGVALLLGIAGWRVWLAVRPPSVARWKTLMAAGLHAQNQNLYRRAERCYAQAIREATRLGNTDLHLADSYTALGDLYRDENRYYRPDIDALSKQIWHEWRHGPIAMLRAEERLEDARYLHLRSDTEIVGCYQRALQIHEVAYGKNSPRLLPELEQLAKVTAEFPDSGNATVHTHLAEQYAYRLHIWQITDHAYGPTDSRTVDALDMRIWLDHQLGHCAELEHYYQDALSRAEAKYGPSSIAIIPALIDLALIYRQMGTYTQSEMLDQRGIAIAERACHMRTPARSATFYARGLALAKRTARHVIPSYGGTVSPVYATPPWDSISNLLFDYAEQLQVTGHRTEGDEIYRRLWVVTPPPGMSYIVVTSSKK